MDLKILQDLGMGHKNKDIAERYDVSPSYVSKIKRGKKDLYIPVTIIDNSDVSFIKNKITSLRMELKMYEELLNIKER